MYALIIALILSVATCMTAKPVVRTAKSRPHDASHNQSHIVYQPIDANSVGDYEGRMQTAGARIGDFVNKGVGGLMHMVNREYGLRDSESFYWGTKYGGNPKANLTAYVGEKNVRVLSLERFQNVLQDAECTPNSVRFTFVKEIQFDRVQKEWQWINDADDHYLVLVTENSRCNMPDGDPTQRQPWHVTKAAFDDSKNMVTLTAKPKTWEDAFSSWHLRVSSRGLLRQSAHPSPRRLKRDEDMSLNLAANFSTEPIEFVDDEDSGSSASIACDPCYTTGSLDFDVDIGFSIFSGITGSVTMTPNDVGAVFTAALEISEELSGPHRADKSLFEVHPDGISIPGFISIGPAFKIDLFAELDATTATLDLFSTGVSMQVPADAVAVLDFDDASKNEWYDWTPVFVPLVPQPDFDGEISLSASAGVEWRVEFDIQVLSWGLSAGLALQAPALGISLTGTGDVLDGGACDNPNAEFGVDFDVNLFAELDVFAGFGAASDLPNRQPLFSTGYDIFSTCLVVDAGGPPGVTSALPSLPPASVIYANTSVAAATSSAAASLTYASSAPVSVMYPNSSSAATAPTSSYPPPQNPGYAVSSSSGGLPQSSLPVPSASYAASSASVVQGSSSAAAAGSSSIVVGHVTSSVAVVASSARPSG